MLKKGCLKGPNPENSDVYSDVFRPRKDRSRGIVKQLSLRVEALVLDI